MEHDRNLDSDFEKIEKVFIKHPFLRFCFGKYMDWVFSKPSLDNSRNSHLIHMLLETGVGSDRTQELEEKLIRAKEVLNLGDEEFRGRFGFQNDLLIDDEEKIHDILAEPLFVLDLDNSSFKNIEKLSSKIVKDSNPIKLADFKAKYEGEGFAVELKTTRMERDMEYGKWLDGGRDDAKKMLLNNCMTKIEEGSRKAFEQLKNTCRFLDCNRKMVAFYNRRLHVGAYLSLSDLADVARDILSACNGEIDYVAIKNHDATELLFHPELGSVCQA